MCLTLPAQVVALHGRDRARVKLNGRLRVVSIVAVPSVQVGDYVLVNLGVAVAGLSAEEAQEVTAALRQLTAFPMKGEPNG